MEKRTSVVGVMSGTSLDGIDYALTEVVQTGSSFKIIYKDLVELPMPQDLKKKLNEFLKKKLSKEEISSLILSYSQTIATQLNSIKRKKKWKCDLVGVHGQTVFHEGKKFSWQIFEPSFLAAKMECPVIFNFRNADVAENGQGAPLAPLFHQQLALQAKLKECIFLNLGGIANITIINSNKIIAFDTGPANALIDLWMQKKSGKNFDDDGKLASQGKICVKCLNSFLKDKYFKIKPPKSTGKEHFNEEFIKRCAPACFKKHNFADQINILTEVTAQTVAGSIKNSSNLKAPIFVSGGGDQNSYLMNRIQTLLPDFEIESIEKKFQWPSKSIEAGAFAYLAFLRWKKVTVDTRGITGCDKKSVLLGQVCEIN